MVTQDWIPKKTSQSFSLDAKYRVQHCLGWSYVWLA